MGLLERGAGLPPALEAAKDLPASKERPSALQGHRAPLMLHERGLERLGGELQVAFGGGEEATAARGHREAPGNLRASGLLLESRHPPPCALEIAAGDRRLDRIALDTPDRRLAEVDAVELRERRCQLPVGGLHIACGELGEPEGALEERRQDRLLRQAVLGRGSDGVEPPGMAVEIRPPDLRGSRGNTLLRERVVHPVCQLLRLGQVSRPRLDDHPVQQDVGERGAVARVLRLPFGVGESPPRPVEVVHVAQPLAELEHHAPIDGRGRRALLECERALRSLDVQALSQEEIGPDASGESGGGEPGIQGGTLFEHCECGSCGGGGPRQIDRAGEPGDRDMAVGAEERVPCNGKSLLGQSQSH